MKPKWYFFLWLTAWLITGCSNPQQSEQTKEVAQAGFESKLLEGGSFRTIIEPSEGRYNHLRIEDFSGRPLVLSFFSTSCPECINKIPHLNDMANRYGEQLSMVGVLVESISDQAAQEFVDFHNIAYPVVVGGGAFRLADAVGGVRLIPATHIYNAQGEYVFHIVGPAPQSMLETRINPLLITRQTLHEDLGQEGSEDMDKNLE